MPSRSFFEAPDQNANAALLRNFSALEQHAIIDDIASKGFAPLIDEASLAHLIGISPKIIFGITKRPNKHYRTFALRKRDGKTRTINAPRTYAKAVQWFILDNILSNISHPLYVTGFVRGSNIFKNAEIHVGSAHFYNTDLQDFFPNINYTDVLKVFGDLNVYSSSICEQLAKICTFNNQLPQGAPTSPCIANTVAKILDQELSEYCIGNGFKYSRYADDITISSKVRMEKNIIEDVANIIQRNSFKENLGKRRFRGPGQRAEVTGLVVSENKAQLPRDWRKRARAAFFQARNNLSPDKEFFNQVAGYYGVIAAGGDRANQKLLEDGRSALNSLKDRIPKKSP